MSYKYETHVCYDVIVGSTAHGTATKNSDQDRAGFFLIPTKDFFLLKKTPQTSIKRSDGDGCWWEFGHYINLLLKANPAALESLWSPHILRSCKIAKETIDLRDCFLSKTPLLAAYQGVIGSWLGRAKKESQPRKTLSHVYRLSHQIIHLLQTGQFSIQPSTPEHLEITIKIKTGEISQQEAMELATGMFNSIANEATKSQRQPQRDLKPLQDFLYRVRKENWDTIMISD